jgi:hypothetical protein
MKDGVPELAEMTENGGVALDAAATVATLPKEDQEDLVALGPDAVKQAASKVREAKREQYDDGAFDPTPEKWEPEELHEALRQSGVKQVKYTNKHAEMLALGMIQSGTLMLDLVKWDVDISPEAFRAELIKQLSYDEGGRQRTAIVYNRFTEGLKVLSELLEAACEDIPDTLKVTQVK